MVDFPNGALVTPERVVVLGILRVGISGSCEDLVPECGVAVCVGDTVRWLNGDREDSRGSCEGHACCEHHLLTVAMESTVIGIPGSRQGEGDVDLLMGFPA